MESPLCACRTSQSIWRLWAYLAMDNPQIAWYVNTLDIGVYYERKQVEEMLTSLEVKPKDAKSIVPSSLRMPQRMEQQTSTINFMTLMAMDTVFNPNFAFFNWRPS